MMHKDLGTFRNSLGMKFVFIHPCTFMMGSPPDEKGRYENEIRHPVTLTKGFWIQTTPVTQVQWTAIMDSNSSYFKDRGEYRPAENMCWYDCQEFINKLNETEGKNRYRLPYESEWECACRAGGNSSFCFGDDELLLEEYAWYFDNSELRTHPVGEKRPNDWGLYDMHGSVWEWCQDWYGEYPSEAVSDPDGPPEGANKVVRGEAWYFYAESCRSASRNYSFIPQNLRQGHGNCSRLARFCD